MSGVSSVSLRVPSSGQGSDGEGAGVGGIVVGSPVKLNVAGMQESLSAEAMCCVGQSMQRAAVGKL